MLVLWIILTSIFYAGYLLSVAAASARIDHWLSTTIFNAVGAFMPLMIILYTNSKNIFVTKYGIFWSVVAGILISAYCITLFKSFTLGPVSFIVPIVYGVTLILTSFGGVILFKEALSGGEILGISLVVLGILIIGISRYQTA